MIGLSVNAANLADLKGLIGKFLAEIEGAKDLSANVHINIEGNYSTGFENGSTLGVAVGPTPVPESAKTTKPKKGKDAAPAPVQTDIEDRVEHVSSASVTAASETSHDDVVAALSDVNGKKGMQAVRDIIGKVGAKKVNEVKPEDRAAVVAAAKAVV